MVVTATVATDTASREPLWATTSSLFIRGDGGWGGDRGPSRSATIPDRNPDHSTTYTTRPDQALLYRLSGDRNPLHSDPKFAAMGGFDRPILHGLCTFGFTGRALLHTLCGSDPDRLYRWLHASPSPCSPGENLTVAMWVTAENSAMFRTTTEGGVVIDAGRLEFRGSAAS